MIGVAGRRRRSRLPAALAAADAAAPARAARRDDGARLRAPRLALVAVGQRDPHARVRRPPRRATTAGRATSAARRAPVERRCDLLARGAGGRRASCAPVPGCARSRWTRTAGRAARSTTTRDGRLREQRAARWSWPPTAIGTPRLLLNSRSRALPGRPGQPQRAGGQEPDVPPFARSPASSPSRSTATRARSAAASSATSSTRPTARAASCAATVPGRPRHPGRSRSALGGFTADRCPGARPPRRLRRALRPHAQRRRDGRGPARGAQRVTLDPALTDAHGIPAPLVRYR